MYKATTIICVRRNGKVAMAGDGQVTLGETVLKSTARKIRKLYSDTVLVGFSGTGADEFYDADALYANTTDPLRLAVAELLVTVRREPPIGTILVVDAVKVTRVYMHDTSV